jgi:hypothetical protein
VQDYFPLMYNHQQPDPDPKPEEDQEGQQPVVVDVVYNTHEAQNGKTVALTVSLRLPNASWCPHCEVVAPAPSWSSNHKR